MNDRQEYFKNILKYLAVFALLLAFYTFTRPLNHSESYDSYTYALFAENYTLGTAPDSRNILFHASNRFLYVAAQSLGLNIGTLDLLIGVNILMGSLTLILFARLMINRFGVAPISAWTGAAFLGLTYGYWRYTAAPEVYIPSMFLILCSLTLLLKYLDRQTRNWPTLLAAGVVSGLAVLYYQPNVIALIVTIPILFLKPLRLVDFLVYAITASLVLFSGIVWSFIVVNGSVPGVSELAGYANSRYEEFSDPPTFAQATKKLVLAAGHDVMSAHWTRTVDVVRNALDPYIPGCVYNFNVIIYAGKGLQYFTAIAAILFVPILILFARIHWIASREWKISWPSIRTAYLLCWFGLMTMIVATVDPGSFEAWIPVLLPVAGLLTIFVFEPCRKLGKQKSLVVFLLLLMCYNFFGGLLILRNQSGNYFQHKTAWIRQELGAEDTVLFNEHDYRILDYLIYHSDARVVFLTGEDNVTIGRNTYDIYSMPVDDFLTQHRESGNPLYVLDDVLTPDPAIRNCRYGDKKLRTATRLAERLKGKATLVNEGIFGSTWQVKP